MSKYVVDSNFFIQAHRALYPLDIALGFWDKVKRFADSGVIESIDKVKNEIYKNEDNIKVWCVNHLPSDFFKSTETLINEYTQLAQWAVDPRHQFKQTAIDEFLDADEADAWLIAYAMKNNLTVITYEVSAPGSKKKIKIPDVCINFGVRYINTIEMFRELNETF